jgi:hypothetical protein
MTPDERTLLQNFLSDLNASRPAQKDGEADRMIGDALRASPDAAYVLVQHALMSDQALHAAQDQIAQLQAQLRSMPVPAPASSGAFLGGQGAAGPSPWARAAAPPPPQPQYQYQDQYAQQAPPSGGGFFGPGPLNRGGGLGSFLRGAGTTAAGVAGGALLFDGISNLFGGHHGGGFGGFGGGGFGGGFGGQPEEIIENNYYGSDQGGGFGGGDPGGGWDTGGDDGGSFDT